MTTSANGHHAQWVRLVPPLVLVVLDAAALIAAIVVAGEPGKPTAYGWVAVALVLLATGRLYRPPVELSMLEVAPAVVGRILVAAAFSAAARESISDSVDLGPRIRLAVVAVLFALVGRALGYTVIRALRRAGVDRRRVAVLGAGAVGREIVERLRATPEHGLLPVAVFDPAPMSPALLDLPVYGRDESLAEVVSMTRADVIVVAFANEAEQIVVNWLRSCGRLPCEVFVVPRFFELAPAHSFGFDHVSSLPLVRLNPGPYRARTWMLKRALDVALASVILALLSPLFLATSLVVFIDGGRPIFFRQERVGLDGKPFIIWKFRTYRPTTERESATRWTLNDNQQVSRVARWLRAASLDELPQLWNVVRGDMSLVGPRPERPFFARRFEERYPHYGLRHRVPVGLTGWAQVHGLRGNTSIEQRARFDNQYIDNWTFWNDMKILLKTIPAVVRRRGE